MELPGKVILVTGATGRIGKGICAVLAREGARLAAHRLGPTESADFLKSLPGDHLLVEADLRDHVAAEAMAAQVASHFGQIDALVNNAGLIARADFLTMSSREWEAVIETNLTGTFYCSQAVARRMETRGAGTILMISSVDAFRPAPRRAHYAASKAGLLALVANLALELAPHGIRVNGIAPGWIETPKAWQRGELPFPGADRERLLRSIPAGRPGNPEEVGELVSFLLSDRCPYLLGSTITLDGGLSLPRGY